MCGGGEGGGGKGAWPPDSLGVMPMEAGIYLEGGEHWDSPPERLISPP